MVVSGGAAAPLTSPDTEPTMTYAVLTIPERLITKTNTLRATARARIAKKLEAACPGNWTIGELRFVKGEWELFVGVPEHDGGRNWAEGYLADYVYRMAA
jgi:hypothetical protein